MKHKIYKHKDDGIIHPSNSTSTYDTGTIFIATETAARCRYVHVLVTFNGGCYQLLYSTTKSSFEFWLHQAYHAVSQIDSVGSISRSQCPFLHSVLLYIQIGTRIAIFWCGSYIIIFAISIFKFGFLFTVASSNVSSSRKLEYEEEEYHEWLQQWHFKRRSRAENKIHLWNQLIRQQLISESNKE